MAHAFHIVDVFAERPHAGNPLAVVIADDALPDALMQSVAAEINFSETTFVASRPGTSGYRTRIFTPAREIAFAGHPILGTAWIVRRHLEPGRNGDVTLDLAVGPVAVSFERNEDAEVPWFTAPAIALGPLCDALRIAPALGLSAQDIDDRLPVQQCTAGVSAVIVPVRGLGALMRSRLDLDAFAPLRADGISPLVYLFTTETHDPASDLCARFFFEAHGVREDPATGNGAAFLGAYLAAHRAWPGDTFSLRIEQGHALNRPSRVLLHVRQSGDAVRVRVGGGVIPVVHGQLL